MTKLAKGRSRPDPREQHMLATRVDSETYKEFKMLAASQFMGTADALNEALADWFKKHERRVPASVAAKLQQLGLK